ncbi:MAG: ribonuclease HII [Clostridia bacterium]|nr:ribonuclease HII [Clostridia bacterium]
MFDYENKYNQFGLVAGIDEAGRGPLAGPVCCACVIMPLEKEDLIEGINDSKKLSAKKRDLLFEKIIEKAISYKIVLVDEKKIDEINILNATKLGMKRALEGLSVKPQTVLIDAVKIDTEISQVNIIRGDALSYNIASASILAKVFRDRFMGEMSKKFPNYHFEKHKGYGTKEHIELLKKFGKCDIHRDSFIKHFVG